MGPCDVNKDGVVNVVDVQIAADNGVACPTTAFATFYSQVVTGVFSSCPVTSGLHTVSLGWTASTTNGVTYNVYRASTSGGYNYAAPLNTSAITGTSFSDCSVALSQTYYYVVRAVDSSGNQSANSTEMSVTTPST
jgi:fibronectin type 3 domain-containing protein